MTYEDIPATTTATDGETSELPVVPAQYIYPFVIVTTLFALWGFANDITNPLVAVFKDVFVIDNAQSTWVQMAFYGGYATMALPAAIFIRKFSYKVWHHCRLGAVRDRCLTLGASSIGCELQSVHHCTVHPDLWVGISGDNRESLTSCRWDQPETSTRRLNLAQAFNPIGSLTGMFIAGTVILVDDSSRGFQE